MRSPRRYSGRTPWGPPIATLRTAVVRSCVDASGNNSVVECDIAKGEVAGSNPVSRSTLLSPRARPAGGTIPRYNLTAPSPSGKAEVCKTSIPGSNPGGASIFSRRAAWFRFRLRAKLSLTVPELSLSAR